MQFNIRKRPNFSRKPQIKSWVGSTLKFKPSLLRSPSDVIARVSLKVLGGPAVPEESHFPSTSLHSTTIMQEQFEPMKNDLLLRAARGILVLCSDFPTDY